MRSRKVNLRKKVSRKRIYNKKRKVSLKKKKIIKKKISTKKGGGNNSSSITQYDRANSYDPTGSTKKKPRFLNGFRGQNNMIKKIFYGIIKTPFKIYGLNYITWYQGVNAHGFRVTAFDYLFRSDDNNELFPQEYHNSMESDLYPEYSKITLVFYFFKDLPHNMFKNYGSKIYFALQETCKINNNQLIKADFKKSTVNLIMNNISDIDKQLRFHILNYQGIAPVSRIPNPTATAGDTAVAMQSMAHNRIPGQQKSDTIADREPIKKEEIDVNKTENPYLNDEAKRFSNIEKGYIKYRIIERGTYTDDLSDNVYQFTANPLFKDYESWYKGVHYELDDFVEMQDRKWKHICYKGSKCKNKKDILLRHFH